MNLKSAFALLAAGTFLVACGADEVVNINDEAKDKATITLKVMDNHDGSAIEEVTVYSVVDDKEKKSDKLGLSVWKDQELGSHAFQVSKEGYATILLAVDLAEQGQGNVARVGDVIEPVYMYKTGVTAQGTVLYTDDKGNRKAVEGAVVYATLPNIFVPSELSTKTDKNGEYKFENLPEGVSIDISVGQTTIDKKTYAGATIETIGGATYRAGDATNVDIINMTKVAAQLVLVSSNLDAIDSTSTIKLQFSTELNADSVKNKWTVEKSTGGLQMIDVALGDDKKSITIKLIDGKWQKGSRYDIEGYAYATTGNSTRIEKSFTVGSSSGAIPDNVTDLKIAADEDYPTTRAVMTWKAATKTSVSYTIWYKTKEMSSYEQLSSSYYDMYSSSAEATIYVSYLGDEGDKISFKLLPYNSNGFADMSKAKAVDYTIPEPKTTVVVPTEDDEEEP